jgi:DNA-directed RNA polymerase alpha subunit
MAEVPAVTVPVQLGPVDDPRELHRRAKLAALSGLLAHPTRRDVIAGQIGQRDDIDAEAAVFDCLLDEAGRVADRFMEQERLAALSDGKAGLWELNLSVRATNCLESAGIDTVEKLVARTARELAEIRHFGATTLDEVRRTLSERGLRLAGDPDSYAGTPE